MKYQSYIHLTAVIIAISATMAQAAVTDFTFNAFSGFFTGLTGATSPVLSGGNLDDGYWNGMPIGFAFTYNGTNYTTASASTNGWMTLGQDITHAYNFNNLTFSGNRPVIAPLWDDLAMDLGKLSYKTEGTAPWMIFTAEWLCFKWNYNAFNPVISFQVKLYQYDNRIEFVYQRESDAVNNGSASIGITDIGTGPGNFLSLDGTGSSPGVSSTVETNTLNIKPYDDQVYRFTPPATGVECKPQFYPGRPKVYSLSDNYPNPANGRTIIYYTLPQPGQANIKIYDVVGRLVKTLVQGQQPDGYHSVAWDGKDSDGNKVATGIYLYRMSAGNYTKTNKMTVLR